MNGYPLEENLSFRYVCPGCGTRRVSVIPRHNAPFFHRCDTEGCGWTMNVQTDPAGLAVGFTAPLPKKPELKLVK